MTAEKLSVLSNIEDIVKEARYLTSSNVDRSPQSKEHVIRYDFLTSRIKANGNDYNAILTVEVYDYQNKMKTYRLENIEMTPADSLPPAGHVPARTGADQNSVQHQLRTGPRNSVASSSNSILADGAENVNIPNDTNFSINSNLQYYYSSLDSRKLSDVL